MASYSFSSALWRVTMEPFSFAARKAAVEYLYNSRWRDKIEMSLEERLLVPVDHIETVGHVTSHYIRS